MTKRGPKPKERSIETPLRGLPEPPISLEPEARKHWKRVVPLLAESGYLSRLDADALAFYVTLWSRWREAEAKVKEMGAVVVAGGERNSYLQANPWYTIATQCLKDMKAFLAEFGLSPKARLKLIMPEPEAVDPKWADLD